MSLFLDTRGLSTVAIGICDRCKMKVPLAKMRSDGNSPGLRVCDKPGCWDNFDPWRLPARRPEDITLRFPRPEESLVPEPPVNIFQYIVAAGDALSFSDAAVGEAFAFYAVAADSIVVSDSAVAVSAAAAVAFDGVNFSDSGDGGVPPFEFDDNAVFVTEGDSTSGWSASSNGSMSASAGYVRLTRGATPATPAVGTKSLGAAWVATNKDWILIGKFKASRGADHTGAIWFLNNGDPINPDSNAAIWFGSTNASTGGYVDTALSIVCTTSGGTVRNTASLGTGYAYDTTPVEFALHYDTKWSVLNCYIKQPDGTWLWKARVAGEWFEPPDIQMAVASTAPSGAYVEHEFLSQCRPNFMVIGDSIAAGKTGFSPDPADSLTDPSTTWQRYCVTYSSLRNTVLINKGVGGQSSTEIKDRLDADVLSHSPRVVYLHASTNDTIAGVSLATRTTNIQTCVNDTNAIAARVVLLNAMYGTSANPLNPTLRDYMLEWWDDYRPTLVGVYDAVDIMAPLISGGYMNPVLTNADGIHPLAAGYELIGEEIAPVFP